MATQPLPQGDRAAARATAHAAGSASLLTVAEVASRIRVSNMTVYRLIKGGDLPAVRVGKSFRIREADLESFLEAHVEGR